MATLDFPAFLPKPSVSSYSFTPVSGNVRTEVDAGPARVRRRFTQTPTDFEVTWKFSLAQLGIFEAFYDNDLNGGSSWFYIKLVNGAGENTYTARFKQPYQAHTAAREFSWEVTATLEVLSRPLPS